MSAFTIRGRLLDFAETSQSNDDANATRYVEDGMLIVDQGRIQYRGAWNPDQARGENIDHRPNLVMPGFIDLHLHMPQMQVIASYAPALLEWLEWHTFPEEARFADVDHCAEIAEALCDQLITHGTTTAVAYGSVHPASADALFRASAQRNMAMIAGKVMMDRGAPESVLDTAISGYEESRSLIEKWHGKDRLKYAITPRFAITSTPEQLEAAGSLVREYPDCYVQTHIDENSAEIELTAQLYPDHQDYMAIYEHYGLLGDKTLLGHCIHMKPREIAAMIEHQSVAVHCPTSNLFLGSGLFDREGLIAAGARIGLATDIGGGTNYSMLRTLDEAYKIQQLQGRRLDPLASFAMITRGNAEALGLQSDIGTLDEGSFADLVVLDANATDAMAWRAKRVETLEQELFLLQTLGDDRAISACYIAGVQHK